MPVLIDTNVILDLVTDVVPWAAWSSQALNRTPDETLVINPMIYAELCTGAPSLNYVDKIVSDLNLQYVEIPKEALYLSTKAYRKYRSRGGSKSSPLPDFFIGAHASILGCSIITRDVKRYRTYFPEVPLIHP